MNGKPILLVLIVGLIVAFVITNSDIFVSDTSTMIVPAQINVNGQNGVTAVIGPIEVDRNDDPQELLLCTPAPNDCSLRQAINLANSRSGPTTIRFADHYIITLASALPTLTGNQIAIQARPDQEVHINGNNIAYNVFFITGSKITLEGLRIYGAGAGYSNVRVGGVASEVVIAHNVIGDDDAPSGNCGWSQGAYGGIYVDGREVVATAVRVWIYGNIIECHQGTPGDGITILTDKVVVGQDSNGLAEAAQRNTIRLNNGVGVRVGDQSGNTITNNLMHGNQAENLQMTNFDNNIMHNDLR